MNTYRLANEPRRNAGSRPGRPALTSGSRTRTYGELDERTSRLAQALLASGVRAGSRVAVLDRSSIEVIEVLLAAAKVGAITVPLNWRLDVAELLVVVEDAEPAVLIAHQEFRASADVVYARVPSLRAVVVIGDPTLEDDYETFLSAGDPVDPGFEGDVDEVVLQLYTSGTTGAPKGVLTTNRNLGACTSAGGPWGFDDSSVSLGAMPMFHIAGLGWALVGLANGAHTVIVRELLPSVVLDLLESERITNVFLVPTVIGMLIELPGAADRDYTALRSIAYGSSPITPALLRRAVKTFGRPLFQLYGLTETHGAITQLDATDHDPGGPREYLLSSAGRPYPWVELRIASLDDPARTAEVDEPGEIWIRSPQNTPGYFHRPDETAALIDGQGWLHSGDVGRVDADGYLFISDRLKDMIITGGENVYPIEVEAVLSEHPEVAGVAVIGLPDPRWGEAVSAVVVRTPGATVTPDALITYTRGRLAGYKTPKHVEFVAALPVGPTGKILKRQLRDEKREQYS